MTEYIKSIRKMVGHAPVLVCGASVIVVNQAGELLLQRRCDNGCWGYHGGSVELNEVVEEAAKREMLEETGLNARSLELFGVFSGPDLHYVYPQVMRSRSSILCTFAGIGQGKSDLTCPKSAICVFSRRISCLIISLRLS